MKSQVSLISCTSYRTGEVEKAVSQAVGLLEGWDTNLKATASVLIKPNLLTERVPEAGVTTHPEVLRAVIRLFKGRVREILVGDSPGGIGKNTDEVYKLTQARKVCEEEGVHLVKFDDPVTRNGIPITKKVLDCDFFVSVPKFKTHTLTTLTCGIKNSFGLIPGSFKTQCHLDHPTVQKFSRLLVDVFSIRKPDLVVLDAIVAMEGDGPATGPLKSLNLVAAANDAVSLDAVMADIAGLKSFNLVTTRLAHEQGLGEGRLDAFEVTGEPAAHFKNKHFKLPSPFPNLLINSGIRVFSKFIKFRPAINKKLCTLCNLCKESCPVKAIDVEGNIDYKKCILCLCCSEFCPAKAARIKKSILAKIIWG